MSAYANDHRVQPVEGGYRVESPRFGPLNVFPFLSTWAVYDQQATYRDRDEEDGVRGGFDSADDAIRSLIGDPR